MEVIPIALTDQQAPIPNLRTRTFYIVPQRLDELALKDALDTLIRKHWRVLGARLAKNKQSGLYEFHLPKEFKDDHELFKWSSQQTDQPIEKAAPSLDVPSDGKITFLPSINAFDEAFRPSSWPYHMAQDPPNSPLLYVHISLYSNATVIATGFPHIIGDQMGLANLTKAWMAVVEGKTPPPLIGYGGVKEDPLPHNKEYADYQEHERRRKGKMKVRNFWIFIGIILGVIAELVLYPKETQHVLLLPTTLVKSVRERALAELREKYGKDTFISESDIVTAIIIKFCRIRIKKTQWMTLSQTMNLRGRVPGLSGPESAGFIRNALIPALGRFRIAPDTSLGEIAYQNRKAIKDTLRPEEIDVSLAVTREMVRRKQGIMNCEPLESMFAFVNWAAAWTGLDFSGAVVKDEKEMDGMTAGEGREVIVLGKSHEKDIPGRFSCMLMCKTEAGYWCDFVCTPRTLEAVKAHLAKDPELMKEW